PAGTTGRPIVDGRDGEAVRRIAVPMHRAMIQRRLSDAHEQLVRARGQLAVLDEQLVAVREIADDSRLRALVAETPLASKDHDEARRQAVVMERSRQALVDRIAELERRQNELLDRLVVESD
ncbi:MAG TPA: hypothetical protein VEJ44_02850, partial [Acidimicrobiales bacterium]|nr:hypothetical protein [Acidimicrobiales bacterium]